MPTSKSTYSQYIKKILFGIVFILSISNTFAQNAAADKWFFQNSFGDLDNPSKTVISPITGKKAVMESMTGLAVSPQRRDIYIADYERNQIWRYNKASNESVLFIGNMSEAGCTSSCGLPNTGNYSTIEVSKPQGIAIDPSGDWLYYIEAYEAGGSQGNCQIKRIGIANASSEPSLKYAHVIAGVQNTINTYSVPLGSYSIGSTSLQHKFINPTNLTFDASGNLYVADPGAFTIWKISGIGRTATSILNGSGGSFDDSTTSVTVFLGGTQTASTTFPVDATATSSVHLLNGFGQIGTDSNGNFFYVNGTGSDYRIMMVAAANATNIYSITSVEADKVYTIAGGGDSGIQSTARASKFTKSIYGMTINANGDIIFMDTNNSSSMKVYRVVKTTGDLKEVAGTGTSAVSGDSYPSSDQNVIASTIALSIESQSRMCSVGSDVYFTEKPRKTIVMLSRCSVQNNAYSYTCEGFSSILSASMPAGFAPTIEWQKYSSGNWQSINGESTYTYTLPNQTIADNGTKYRIKLAIEDCASIIDTNIIYGPTFTINVAEAPVFTTDVPNSFNTCLNTTFSINVTVSAALNLSYQWYKMYAPGNTPYPFAEAEDDDKATVKIINTNTSFNGHKVFCEVTMGCYAPDGTKLGDLTVSSAQGVMSIVSTSAPTLAIQPFAIYPFSNTTGYCSNISGIVSASVDDASVGSISYVWDKGSSSQTIFAINFTSTTAIKSFSTIFTPTLADNGTGIYMLFSNTCVPAGVKSNILTLTVYDTASFSLMPIGGSMCVSDSFTITVQVNTPNNPSSSIDYRWQSFKEGQNQNKFNNIGGNDATSSSLNVAGSEWNTSRNDSYFRCEVQIDGKCPVYSDQVRLGISANINRDPSGGDLYSQTLGCTNQTLTLTFPFDADNAHFVWYMVDTSNVTSTLTSVSQVQTPTLETSTSYDLGLGDTYAETGRKYYCEVKNACGTITSTITQITVKKSPTFTLNIPSSSLNCVGMSYSASINVDADDSNHSISAIEWYKALSTAPTFKKIPSMTGVTTLSFNSIVAANNKERYKAVVLSTNGCENTSNILQMSVSQGIQITKDLPAHIYQCVNNQYVFSFTLQDNTGLSFLWFYDTGAGKLHSPVKLVQRLQ